MLDVARLTKMIEDQKFYVTATRIVDAGELVDVQSFASQLADRPDSVY